MISSTPRRPIYRAISCSVYLHRRLALRLQAECSVDDTNIHPAMSTYYPSVGPLSWDRHRRCTSCSNHVEREDRPALIVRLYLKISSIDPARMGNPTAVMKARIKTRPCRSLLTATSEYRSFPNDTREYLVCQPSPGKYLLRDSSRIFRSL